MHIILNCELCVCVCVCVSVCVCCMDSARLVVTKRGQFFVVEDREIKKEDKTKMTPAIVMKPRVKTIQNVKSVLGEC